jgi:hypothetical protein
MYEAMKVLEQQLGLRLGQESINVKIGVCLTKNDAQQKLYQ